MANIQPYSEYDPSEYIEFLGFAYGDGAYKYGQAYAARLANAELTEENKIISARGHAQLGTATWNYNRIREILQFRRSGVDVLLCFGSDSSGTSAAISKVTSPWTSALAFTEVKTLTDVNTEAVLMQVSDNAYLFNGSDDQWYDGTSWYDIGASAPSSAASFSSNVSGSLNTSSTYIVSYAWYDSTNKRRTNAAPLSSMTSGATGATAGLRITLPGSGAPSGYDKAIILCTVAYGSQLLEDQIVDATATSADITQSDTLRLAGYIYEGNNDAPASDFDIAVFANSKIYGGRTDDKNCIVYRSKYSFQFGAMPQSFPPLHFTPCEPSYSDRLVGLGVVGSQENQTVIVVKQKSFGKIIKINDDTETYQKIADIGGYGQKSIFQLGELCGFFSEGDIIVTDGSTYKRISGGEDGKAISQYIKTLDTSFKTRFYAKNITSSKQIRISCVTSGQTWQKLLLLGHYDYFESRGIVKWTTREQGPNTSTYPGVQASSIVEVLNDSNELIVLYGNSQANGKLYQADTGNTDDGSYIYKNWIFRSENFGNFRDEKLFGDILAKVRVGNASTSIYFSCQKNLSNSTQSLATKTFSGTGFVFGTGKFGITAFSTTPVSELVIPCQVRAREMAVVVRETTDKSFQLIDFVMTGMP